MNKLNNLLYLALLIFSNLGYSQAVEPSNGVGKSILQIELEGQFANEKEGSPINSSWMVPNTLLRYGISDKIELQMNVPYMGERFKDPNNPTYVIHRFDDAQFGASINLWQQNKFIPETALMVRAILPTSDLSFDSIGEIIALNFSNQITNTFSLNYNLGYIHEAGQAHSGYYIVNLSYAPNDTWHFYVENTGEFNQGEKVYELLNGGFGINFLDQFCADFSVGKGVNRNTYYTGIILSWAFDTSTL